MAKPNYVGFKIDPEDKATVAALAAAKGYSLSEMIRLCLRAGLRLAPDFPTKPLQHAIRARRAA